MPMPKLRLTATNSEIATYRDCPAKWGFMYAEGLRPKRAARPLTVGSMIHKGIGAGWETWRDTIEKSSLERLRIAQEVGRKAAKEHYNRYLASLIDLDLSADDLDEASRHADEDHELAEWMVHFFFHMTYRDFSQFVPVLIEKPFLVPIPDVLGRPSHVWYEGVFDLVAYDPAFNQIVLCEHKTTAGQPSGLERGLEFDPQVSGYLHALAWMRDTNGLCYWHHESQSVRPIPKNASVGRVLYNVIRKKVPSQPKWNKDGTVSVAQIDTLAEIYREALHRQVDAGKPITDKQQALLDTLDAKGSTSFFGRTEFFKSPSEMERWRSEAYVWARSIRRARREPELRVRNPGHCTKPWSQPCPMRDVCNAPNDPNVRGSYRVATDPHEEVEEARRDDEEI